MIVEVNTVLVQAFPLMIALDMSLFQTFLMVLNHENLHYYIRLLP